MTFKYIYSKMSLIYVPQLQFWQLVLKVNFGQFSNQEPTANLKSTGTCFLQIQSCFCFYKEKKLSLIFCVFISL